VTKVDPSQSTVTTSSGSTIKYDHLVLAPGGKPRKIPIEGKDLENVVTLRFVEDAKKITSNITKETDVVVIGTSFIGMEVAAAILKKEPKSVTLVGVDAIPFEAILGKDIGKAIMENMKSQGIKFLMEAGVEKILPSSKSTFGFARSRADEPQNPTPPRPASCSSRTKTPFQRTSSSWALVSPRLPDF
jgi:NADPH-dependent 2,4-dienoyl-CoA reductase/sulfur reductase-like enzyme